MSEAFVQGKELRKFFGISERQFTRWLKEGCPCVRVGSDGRGQARFRISAVEAWLEARTAAAKR